MRWHLAAVAGLVLLQLAVPVWYGGSEMADDPFLDAEEITSAGDASLGQVAMVYGQVVSVDPLVISHSDSEGAIHVRVVGAPSGTGEGQYLEVYGTVVDRGTVRATTVVTRGEFQHWYTYGISVLAVVVVALRIGRDWQLDRGTWTLEPREYHDA